MSEIEEISSKYDNNLSLTLAIRQVLLLSKSSKSCLPPDFMQISKKYLGVELS